MAENRLTELYEHTLETVFCGFIRRNPKVLAAIAAFEGAVDIRNDALEFTLPALHEFCCRSYAAATAHKIKADRKGYLEFRKALYQSPTNQRLGSQGGRVDVGTSNPDHDLTIYKLVRITAPDPSD